MHSHNLIQNLPSIVARSSLLISHICDLVQTLTNHQHVRSSTPGWRIRPIGWLGRGGKPPPAGFALSNPITPEKDSIDTFETPRASRASQKALEVGPAWTPRQSTSPSPYSKGGETPRALRVSSASQQAARSSPAVSSKDPTPAPSTPAATPDWVGGGDDDDEDEEMEYTGGSGDALPLAHSLIESASRLRKRVALNGTTDISLEEKREIADGLASMLAIATRADIMTWGSGDLASAVTKLAAGSRFPQPDFDNREEDMPVDDTFEFTPATPPPPPLRAMMVPRRHAPQGARPLPQPPVGRGGPAFKGRGIPPPPPINLSTKPPPVKGTYAKTAQFTGGLPPSSVDSIVRLAKAFPELPTKQLEVMNRAAGYESLCLHKTRS
jgi:hypothetical protein